LKIKKIIKWKSIRHLRWLPFFAAAESIRYHRYQIEYIEHHEIICPRYTFADGTYVVLLPWFLIPGRPYPAQIYLYACELYSSNPDIGQRGVAKATRSKFKLSTFSHSTVSRSFRSFEEAKKRTLDSKFGEEVAICGTGLPMLIAAAPKTVSKSAKVDSEKRFRSTVDTLTRREAMCGFFPKFISGAKRSEIESISIQFMEDWYKKNRRLLL
jgi:hypothetical protein